ncbi:MAG: acyl-CoA dehydrogenase family protein [Sphingobium sp.]
MPSFTPPVAEQRFLLADSGIDADILDAVLDGAGQIAADVWAPIRIAGDREGAAWTADGVRMPTGHVDAYRAFVEGGWGTIGAPERSGGQGLPFALQMAAIDSLGCANAPLTLCPILSNGAVEALAAHGSADQQARYLPRLVSGEWTGTMNLTEPQAGSDVGALRSRATPRGDGTWSIAGTKIFISYGEHDLSENIVHLVLARTPGAPEGTRGISLFLVPRYRLNPDGTPGAANDVRAVSIEHKLGLHASPTCVMSFGENGDCVGELIGPEHGGMRAMFTMMNNARLFVGLQGVQVAEAATQAAVAYARERVQSALAGAADRAPVPIIAHPDVRRMLLRMRAQTDAARALVYAAAAQVDHARAGVQGAEARLALLTPLAKAHATDIGCEVSALGIQVHGGVGFVEETGVAQFQRDSRVFPIYEGTNGIQAADLVSRKLVMEGGAPFAALVDELRTSALHPALRLLIDSCAAIGAELQARDLPDRLAGSAPFLTMLATAVGGGLLEAQGRRTMDESSPFAARKRAAIMFHLDQIVPEAAGLAAAARASGTALAADAFG